ncbi:FAD-dependent oxidoreductase [Desulfosarcina ovata]|uniref:Thioredoxin reductase n=1 Tax=Desulfosarcina ovata subsp. ovata TaxID=2752305 RepID=A0A5K8ACM1_9BACT|nr:FAD-dependent oxidoreductase [Desulfosarcina ovata]BBO90249.1 thioredoxin reductase [Desulfosarcina ovata subsp. ovata]
MNQQNEMNEAQMQQVQMELGRILSGLKHEIPIFLFTQDGKNDVFNDAARQALRFFRQLTDKIVLREFDLGHDKAKEMGVENSPTLVFDPDRYNIRWLGAPLGEEGRIFLEVLLRIGTGKSDLNEAAMEVLKKIDQPRHVKVFVSASCPYCPQQALNALKTAVAKPDTVSLEIIDTQANTDLADQYGAHSVPQAFANDMLIALGAQTEELFVSSLDKMTQQTVFIPESDADEVECQLVIIGGGPAGLTAGIYAARSGLKSVVVEKGVLGGQVALTPVVENYPGMKQVGGKTLVDIMVTHALEYVDIFPGEAVVDIIPGQPHIVQTSRRKFKTQAVLLATGASHRNLGVPGEAKFSGRGVSYCATCDGPLFRGKRVFMVGGGNSAVTEALHLHNMGVDVTLVHRRDRLKAQEVLTHQLNDNGIPVRYNTEVKEVLGDNRVTGVKLLDNTTGETATEAADGVFLAIGYDPTVDLARKVGLEMTEDGYIKHNEFRTNIPGIYVAGDVTGGSKQIVTAAGYGSEAALAVFEDIINPYWKKA